MGKGKGTFVGHRRAEAEGFVSTLNANVDALYAGTITHEEHHARNVRTWNAVAAKGRKFHDLVLAILRGDYEEADALSVGR